MSVCVCVHVHMYACTCVCVMGALKLPQQTPTAAQLLELTKQQHIHLCQFPQNNFHFKLDKKKRHGEHERDRGSDWAERRCLIGRAMNLDRTGHPQRMMVEDRGNVGPAHG